MLYAGWTALSLSHPLCIVFSNVALLSTVHERFFYILQCYCIVFGDGYTAQRLGASDAGMLTTSCATSMNVSQDIGRICMVMIQEM
jgi:hypothetical protein